MGWDPEQRNRLFEDKTPLGLPVELPENPAHRDGGNQGAQAPAVFEDVGGGKERALRDSETGLTGVETMKPSPFNALMLTFERR